MTTMTTQTTLSPDDTLGFGCIGVGGRGLGLLRSLLKLPNIAVRAVCDVEPTNRERAAAAVVEAGGKAPVETDRWEELLAQPGIDAVVSALPCDLHDANYLAVIAAGKDLYAEKPMCLSMTECDAVVAAAESSERIVQIGFQRRADPRFIETIRQVHDGELGELVEGRIAWSNAWGPLYGWF